MLPNVGENELEDDFGVAVGPSAASLGLEESLLGRRRLVVLAETATIVTAQRNQRKKITRKNDSRVIDEREQFVFVIFKQLMNFAVNASETIPKQECLTNRIGNGRTNILGSHGAGHRPQVALDGSVDGVVVRRVG